MLRSLALCALLLPCVPTLRAQPTPDGGADDSAAALQEVSVSADGGAFGGYAVFDQAQVTRGNLTLREVPQTVEIIDMEASGAYGHGSLTDVIDGTGGVTVERNSAAGSRDTIRLRGFDAGSTDIYVDGMRGTSTSRYSTANVERVEVLKGPASVLYGRSNGGGVINVVSKQANFRPQKTLELGYGAWAERSATLDVNQVLSPHWAFRVTGQVHRANSFRSRVYSKGEMLSPSVAYQNGPLRWVGQLTYDSHWHLPDRGMNLLHYAFAHMNPRVSIARPEDYSQDRMKAARSELQYDMAPQWILRLQTAWRQMQPSWHHHYNGVFVDNTNYLFQQSYYAQQRIANKSWQHALTLTGEWDSGFIHHKLTTALDYNRTGQSAMGGNIPARDRARWLPPIDLRDPATWVAAPGVQENFTIEHDDQARVENIAWLVQDLMEITPAWKLMLGGRFEQHKVAGIRKHLPGDNRFSFSDTYFSPGMGLVHDLDATHTAYIGYSKSFSPPGGKGGYKLNLLEQYQDSPEHNRQYEAGLKSEWLGGALATQVSVYRLSRYNIPYRPDPDGEPELWAVSGENRARGVELSAVGQMNRRWQVRTSLGFMSAKVHKDITNPQREGLHLGGTSNAQGNLFVRYAPHDAFFAEGGVRWTSHRYRLNTGARNAFTIDYLPGYARVDAALGWRGTGGTPWRATLAVSNLLDRRYWASIVLPGEPRTLRARVQYEF